MYLFRGDFYEHIFIFHREALFLLAQLWPDTQSPTGATTFRIMTLSIATLSIIRTKTLHSALKTFIMFLVIMLRVNILSVVMLVVALFY